MAAGDDVKRMYHWRAKKHQQHGRQFQAAAEAQQKKKNNRKMAVAERSGHLHERLRDARQPDSKRWPRPQERSKLA